MSDIRVRFAPSPTGELHIGGARTALFNYLYIHSAGGKFVLRIDDTDLERSQKDYCDKLIQSLRWLGLNWDEGPYYQSKRLNLYRQEAERLLQEDKAYRCYCSVEELAEGREKARRENRPYLYPGTCRNLPAVDNTDSRQSVHGHVIRLLTPNQGFTVVDDLIRDKVSFDNSGLDDFIIIKTNGLPTYNFASIVDDHDLQISDVIRAEEHLSNTPRQILCAEALGYDLPRFAHVPMILAPDRSKLSKRHGATSVEEFRADGFLPDALLNYMSLLGWSPGDDLEIFSIEEIAARFKLSRVSKTAAIYDTDKLTWLNSHYIREYDLGKLAEAAKPFFEKAGLLSVEAQNSHYSYYLKVIELVRERARTLKELADISTYFFSENLVYDEKGLAKHFKGKETAALLRRTASALNTPGSFSGHSTEEAIKRLIEEMGLSFGKLINPVRLAITGRTGGPGVFDIMALLGREKTIERLERAADFIEKQS